MPAGTQQLTYCPALPLRLLAAVLTLRPLQQLFVRGSPQIPHNA